MTRIRVLLTVVVAAVAVSGCGVSVNVRGLLAGGHGTPGSPYGLGKSAAVGPMDVTVTGADVGLPAEELGAEGSSAARPRTAYARVAFMVHLRKPLDAERPRSQYPEVRLYRGEEMIGSSSECAGTKRLRSLRDDLRWARESDYAVYCVRYDPAKAGGTLTVGVVAADRQSPVRDRTALAQWNRDRDATVRYWETHRR